MKKYINIWTILILVLTVGGIVLACHYEVYSLITWAVWAGLATFFLHLAGDEKKELVVDYNERIRTLAEERDLYREKHLRALEQNDELQRDLKQVKTEFHVYKKEHPDTSTMQAPEEMVQVTAEATQNKKYKKKKKNNE